MHQPKWILLFNPPSRFLKTTQSNNALLHPSYIWRKVCEDWPCNFTNPWFSYGATHAARCCSLPLGAEFTPDDLMLVTMHREKEGYLTILTSFGFFSSPLYCLFPFLNYEDGNQQTLFVPAWCSLEDLTPSAELQWQKSIGWGNAEEKKINPHTGQVLKCSH